MNPNEKLSDSHVTRIKIEPGLSSESNASNKNKNNTQILKKKLRPDHSSVSSTNEGGSLPMIKIKTEPGLSSASSIACGKSNLTQTIKIKTEPGLSSVSSTIQPVRLTSFRPARDLTLTGSTKLEKANKRVFTPNLNVQRNKKKEDGTAVKTEVGPLRGKNRGKGRGQNDRGRGRGRGASNVTQSTGIFSHGISEASRAARRGSGVRSGYSNDREARAQLEKPKLNLNVSIDKADEEQKLKLLLRDDFIDDGDCDINTDNAPVSLPLIKQLKLFNNESENNVIDKKVEVNERKMKINEKPITEDIKGDIPPKYKDEKISLSPDRLTVPDIIENESSGYMILRFPDCLPGLQSSDDTNDQNNYHRNHNEKKIPNNNADDKNKTDYCTLRSLKAGYLGKLQIHQSGKARLQLGDNSLVVDMGSRMGFRQDVVAAKLDGLNKELINLGCISSTLICTPDFESILTKLKNIS